MSSSFREEGIRKYIEDVRAKFGLPELEPDFNGWPKHYKEEEEFEEIVLDAPDAIGCLVALWAELRRRANLSLRKGSTGSDTSSELMLYCERVLERIDIELAFALSDTPGLELRSNGKFVRVVACKIWPKLRLKQPLGPDS